MKIKLKSSLAGPGIAHSVGDVIEVTDEEGERFLAKGLAEKVETKRGRKTEKAAAPQDAVETATE